MLRRRIFSSAMASVMALSSVAVVANAEETAVANVKTKADLEAYVKSFDAFRDGDINDYGSISGEKFLDALEYAENVISDLEATTDDYTVAYAMIEATYNALRIYSVDELKALIESCKAIYETNNEYNEDLSDPIYKNEDGKNQWDNFVIAYEDAESVLDSGDSRIICDGYEGLEAAKNALVRFDVVTKAQFRTALKAYETAKQKVYAYDTWRRGTTGGWVDLTGTGAYWAHTGAKGIGSSFGAMYDNIMSYDDAIYSWYNKLDEMKSVNKTSGEDYVKAYKTTLDACDLINNWIADDTTRASKASVQKLIDQYRGLLVSDYAIDEAYELLDAFFAVSGTNVSSNGSKFKLDKDKNIVREKDDNVITMADVEAGKDPFKIDYTENTQYDTSIQGGGLDSFGIPTVSFKKKTGAGLYICNPKTKMFISLKENGMWDGTPIKTTAPGGKYKTISANTVIDITQFIDVTGLIEDTGIDLAPVAATTATTGADEVVSVDEALEAAAKSVETTVAAAKTFEETLAAATYTEDALKLVKVYIADVNDLIKEIDALMAKIAELLGGTSEASIASVASAGLSKLQIDALTKELNALIDAAKPFTWYGTNEWGNINGSRFNAFFSLNNAWYCHNWDLYNALHDTIIEMEAVAASLAAAEEDAPANKGDETKKKASTTAINNRTNLFADAQYEYIWDAPWHDNQLDKTVGDEAGVEVDLVLAMAIAETYLEGNDSIKAQADDSGIYYINTTDEIVNGTAKGSSAEWGILYRYLKYALEDKYTLTAAASYTMADVKELIEKAYELAEITGDAAIFASSHKALTDIRKVATDWVAQASKDKLYKDWKTYETTYFRGGEVCKFNATGMYNALNGAYMLLERDYSKLKYSFQEIYDEIALVKDMIDCEELEATDTLLKALEDTAYYLSTVKPLEVEGAEINNEAFSSDRYFFGVNRVSCVGYNSGNAYTMNTPDGQISILDAEKSADNATHESLKVAYEALLAEVKAQTEVTVLLGDVNADGVVNAFDASALLKNIVNAVEMDAAVADYDASGVVNALDASAILKAIVNA